MFWFCMRKTHPQAWGTACFVACWNRSDCIFRAFLFHDGIARVCSEECVQFVVFQWSNFEQQQQQQQLQHGITYFTDTMHQRRQTVSVPSCTWPISGANVQPLLEKQTPRYEHFHFKRLLFSNQIGFVVQRQQEQWSCSSAQTESEYLAPACTRRFETTSVMAAYCTLLCKYRESVVA